MEEFFADLVKRLETSASDAGFDLANFKESLGVHLDATFPGIDIAPINPDDDFSAQFNRSLAPSLTFTWMLRGVLVGRDRMTGEFFLNAPLSELARPDTRDTARGPHTKRQLTIWTFTSGRLIGGIWRFASRFDTLSALGQLGVAAVGRPVGRSLARVTVLEKYPAEDLYRHPGVERKPRQPQPEPRR